MPLALSTKAKVVAHKVLLDVNRNPSSSSSEKLDAKTNFNKTKHNYQNLVRKQTIADECERDAEFNGLLSHHPSKVFKMIKSKKAAEAPKIKSLKVGNKTYRDKAVADGFFESVLDLKTLKTITATSFNHFEKDHKHIIKICRAGDKISRISKADALA